MYQVRVQGKGNNSARKTCTCKQALVTPERDKRWDKLTIQCDSQKHITIHCNACLKHFNSSVDRNQRYERDENLLFVCLLPLLCPSSPSSATHGHSHGIWASASRLTHAAENSRKHHRTLDIHAPFDTDVPNRNLLFVGGASTACRSNHDLGQSKPGFRLNSQLHFETLPWEKWSFPHEAHSASEKRSQLHFVDYLKSGSTNSSCLGNVDRRGLEGVKSSWPRLRPSKCSSEKNTLRSNLWLSKKIEFLNFAHLVGAKLFHSVGTMLTVCALPVGGWASQCRARGYKILLVKSFKRPRKLYNTPTSWNVPDVCPRSINRTVHAALTVRVTNEK